MSAMRSDKKLGLALALTVSLGFGCWSAPAQADVNDIYASDNALELRAGGQHLQYRETYNDATLDTENGWMPSLGGGISFLSPKRLYSSWSNVYMRFDAQFTFGETDYEGSLQNLVSGAILPYKNITKNVISQLNAKLGYAFQLGGHAMVIPYADFGYRSWERKLTGAYGYIEHYHHTSVMAGALLQYSPRARWVYSLYVQGGTTIAPQMRTGGEDFDLGERAAWSTEGRVSYALAQRTEIFGVLGYNEFSYGKSAVQPSGYLEPDSRTREVKTLMGMAYRF